MFTGIIEELGTVKDLQKKKEELVLSIKASKVTKDTTVGDSISVSGACLTVINNLNDVLKFDISQETIEKTNIGTLKPNDKVNLERALKADQRLGGHFVTGHIDCIGKIKQKEKMAAAIKIKFEMPAEFLTYIVLKGSIAVDGISLTVAQVSDNSFTAYIIPHTLKNTTLGLKEETDSVNIETDVLAKYINKSLRTKEKSNITTAFLAEHGFI